MANSEQNIRWQLIEKEMDVIFNTIKNLDDIIYKIKNFAFLTWGGSIYLIAQHFDGVYKHQEYFYLLIAIIPILFWLIHFKWQKHIIITNERQRIISEFINHEDFNELIIKGNKLPEKQQFPFYDPVGSIYRKQSHSKGHFSKRYLLDTSKVKWYKIFFYKDAPLFYGTMISLSIALFIVNC